MRAKETIGHLVNLAMKSKKLSDQMNELGYPDNPYWDFYCEAAEALYDLVGESTDTFEESLAFLVLQSTTITEEQRINVLLYHYKKNKAEKK